MAEYVPPPDGTMGLPNLDDVDDPFSPSEAPGHSLVVQMRIYDVLLGIYHHLNPEKANALIKVHENGRVVGSLPAFLPPKEDTNGTE